ncbi:FAD-binding protein [Nocardia panacis]|uniref:FAD-binding protein n=1 Tax=Nocardia panacis TaxID=2340916 RepID=A0A3A4JPK5_9NOCA|nr:FAD-binding protein [Nocardia panacis]RJO70958.1 FAD-binding protein [Nocardia panacis]
MPMRRRTFLAAAAGALALSAPIAHAESPRHGYNRRFLARPDRLHIPSDTTELLDALARSVREDLRVAVRSGGHCFEDFVDSPDTKSLIDLQSLNRIDWDTEHRAFSIGAGATLDTVYTGLSKWGVTIPGGICKGVGAGGHITGGGYGPLSRRHGLVADHLYGVEVATVNARGEVALTVATKDGPHRDLWWAHTGGGGGNFGVVTRFLLRAPDSDGADPRTALPRPTGTVLVAQLLLPRPLATEDSFVRLVGNYLDFHHRHSAPGNRFAGLYARLILRPLVESLADMLIFLHSDEPDAAALLAEFLATVTDGVFPAPPRLPTARVSYLDSVDRYYAAPPVNPARVKIKTALLRQPYSPEQLRVLYRAITDPGIMGETFVEFAPFGGAINAVASDATAMPARDVFMKMLIHAAWSDPAADDRFIAWARDTYREIYRDTGGVPVHDDRNGGSYINYPDPDLADSTTPWHEFYYRDNYPRLQQVKAEWDPKNRFRHNLSITLP